MIISILALYRNRCAIEAQNARRRFAELSEASAAVKRARLKVIRRLRVCYPNPQSIYWYITLLS
jgi:hypothetical protein